MVAALTNAALPYSIVQRFGAELDALSRAGEPLGLAVSGGGDSVALLLLAVAARPGAIAAATVDHRLRASSEADARWVATLCQKLGVRHSVLAAQWAEPPTASIQARAREERYRLLGEWASDQGLSAVATAHHADDQAETLLLRLARSAGLAGLGGIRPSRRLTESSLLIRPLLGWRHSELAAICSTAGIEPLDDPANHDPRHDRTLARRLLASVDWIDPLRLAASASHLRDAEQALDWSASRLVEERLERARDGLIVDPRDLPTELVRRLLVAAFATLGATPPRGPELARAMAALARGETLTLGGLRLVGGTLWRLGPAPPRRGTG